MDSWSNGKSMEDCNGGKWLDMLINRQLVKQMVPSLVNLIRMITSE